MKKFFMSVLATVVAFSSLLLMPLSSLAAADTCTWDGSNSTDWSDGANWTGCDNGGVPEAGDNLVFPSGASSLIMNNDQGALIYQSVVVTGDGYTFGGNNIVVSDSWQFNADNTTVTADIGFTNAGSSTLSIGTGATGNVINGDIILNLSAGGDMNIYTNETINHNGAMTGSTDAIQQGGGVNSWVSSTTDASTFISTNVSLASGSFICRNTSCLGAGTNPVNIVSTGQLQFDGGIMSIPYDISASSTASPQLSQTPGTSLLNGTLTIGSTGTITVQPGGTLLQTGVTTFSSDAYFSGSNAVTSSIYLLGNISGSSTGNTFANGVFLGLGGANGTYNGNFTAQSGAALQAFTASALGNTTGTTEIQSGATLYADTAVTVTEPISVAGTGVGAGNFTGAIVANINTITYDGPITLTGNTIFRTLANGDLDFAGSIGGTGNVQITTGGILGEVSYRGASANTYAGTTTSTDSNFGLYKNAGVVAVPGDLYITSNAANSQTLNNGGEQIANNAKVIFTETGSDDAVMQVGATDTVGSIAGSGDIAIVAPQVFHVGNDNTSTTFSGIIYGGGTLDKVGTGTLTLNGTNPGPFAPFTVSGGKLNLAGNYTGSNITVNSGATLNGTGTAGATTVNTGGTINAGNSPGCLNVAGNLTLTAGANFDEELAGGTACTEYDQTIITGNVNLNNATLNVLPSYTPATGQVFTIITAGSVSGQFSGLAENTEVVVSGLTFRVNYTGTTVTLTYISGTLAATGQNSNSTALLALGIMSLALAGLGIEFASRRRRENV